MQCSAMVGSSRGVLHGDGRSGHLLGNSVASRLCDGFPRLLDAFPRWPRALKSRRLSGNCTRSPPDVVVVGGYAGLTNQAVMRWLHRKRIPWAFWGERPGMTRRSGVGAGLRRLAQRPALRWADGIAAIGSQAVETYQRLSKARCPVANIPYCCDMEPFFEIRRGDDVGKRPIRFLYCGQLIHRKGVDLLVDAFTAPQRPFSALNWFWLAKVRSMRRCGNESLKGFAHGFISLASIRSQTYRSCLRNRMSSCCRRATMAGAWSSIRRLPPACRSSRAMLWARRPIWCSKTRTAICFPSET